MIEYKSVIVGCGPRSHWHANAYKLIERGKLVACCSRNEQKRTAFAKTFQLRGYATVADMLAHEKPDLVHIVTQPVDRVDVLWQVSNAGVPACIIEKPIAAGVKDWKEIVKLEKESQTKFTVGMQCRWHENLTRCRIAIESGQLGRVLFLDFSAGMNISGQGPHIIDWAMTLNEDHPIVRVFAATSGSGDLQDAHPAPDITSAQVIFSNGVHGAWANGVVAPRVVDEDIVWKHCRVAAYAEKGRILYEEFGKWEIFSPNHYEHGIIENSHQWEDGNNVAQAGLTNSVFDWIEDDTRLTGTNLKRALHQWNAVLGIYTSAIEHRPIEIPFDPSDDLMERLEKHLQY